MWKNITQPDMTQITI